MVANPWPKVMGSDMSLTVLNEGVNSTSAGALLNGTDGKHGAWAAEMAAKEAVTHVILGHCTATTWQTTVAQYKADMRLLIDGARAAGKTVWLATPNPCYLFSGASDPWIVAMRDLGAEKVCPIVDMYAFLLSDGYTLSSDNLHPSSATFEKMGHYAATRAQQIIEAPAAAEPLPLSEPNAALYELQFFDEFDGTSLDASKWNNHAPEFIDAEPYRNTVVNYAVEDGVLKIWPQRAANGDWVQRTISSENKFTWQYGYLEWQAKLPVGKGLFPALWCNGMNEEIDVMETKPGHNYPDDDGVSTRWLMGSPACHPIHYDMTVWTWNAGVGANLGDFKNAVNTDLSASFHTWGLKREPNLLSFYFDGQLVHQFTQAFDDQMHILMDVWYCPDEDDSDQPVAGSGTLSATNQYTPEGKANSMEVRYVRCWRFK
jgi:beta-glucanase (GH16 family)